jgi:RNA polymerase sigma factor (sigma-70 family)
VSAPADDGDRRLVELAQAWRAGDPAALEALLAELSPWLRARVRRRLDAELRQKLESVDLVQDALLRFLRYGPRFEVRSAAELRALLLRMLHSSLLDRRDWYHARRRAISRELSLSAAEQTPAEGSAAAPAIRAERREGLDRLRLALELIDPQERRLVVAHALEEQSFAALGAELGLSPDAVRMRFQRALQRLSRCLDELEG